MRNQTFRSYFAYAILALAIASGCTKKKEEKNEVDPNAYLQVSDVQHKKFYFSRGAEDASSDNLIGAVPGFSQDFGVVEARVTESELQFIQVFVPNGRTATNQVIASYKITDHFDIQNDTNDFGEKTHKIVEDRKRPWDQRKYMRVDWATPTNNLSGFASSMVGVKGLEENTVLLETAKIEPGHISFLVETSVLGSRVTYRTHLTAAKPSDYKPIAYSLKDFEKFGYFYTQQNFEDMEKGLRDDGIKRFAETFNVCEASGAGSCATNKITWVLSKDFPEFYKDETKRAIAEWNKVFQEALGRTDTVVDLDNTVQADISDSRRNVINMFMHEVSFKGLLGVAQGIKDPETGEVISARASVFEDGIAGSRAEVDEILDLVSAALTEPDPLKKVWGVDSLKGKSDQYINPYSGVTNGKEYDAKQSVLGLNKKVSGQFANNDASQSLSTIAKSFKEPASKSSLRLAQLAKQSPALFVSESGAKLKSLMRDDREFNAALPLMPERVAGSIDMPRLDGMESLLFASEQVRANKLNKRTRMVKDANNESRLVLGEDHGIHGAELIDGVVLRYLLKMMEKMPLEELVKIENRKRIKDEVSKVIYYGTLLHELGHTFGLRHNFIASVDKKHYYPKYFELAAIMEKEKNLAPEKKTVSEADLVPYESSSVMDYGRDFFSRKGGLGSYDRAAIKYAYNRTIDKENDKIVTDNFLFCTDDQVGESSLCRRHDSGRNVSEITLNVIKDYNLSYPATHFRQDRVRFGRNPYAMMSYFRDRFFLPVRGVMDELLYALISTPRGPGKGLCSSNMVAEAVAREEIANICDYADAEAAGVDPSDYETYSNSLFKMTKVKAADGTITLVRGTRIKPISEYKPNGFADLMAANDIAKSFFQEILGSPEPGRYIAMPKTDAVTKERSFHLESINFGGATDEENLKVFAQQKGEEYGIPDADAFAADPNAKKLLTNIAIDGYGRPLETKYSVVGDEVRTEQIGSEMDKRAALQALSIRDMGVRKYYMQSMNANAYFMPQAKKYTTRLMNRFITRNERVTAFNVQVEGYPQPIAVTAPAAMNADTQMMATIFAAAYMTSDTEKSMLAKLRVCDINDNRCDKSQVGKVAEFESSELGNRFRAAQTFEGDSIAFDLITAAAKADKERNEWLAVYNNREKALGDAILKFTASDLRIRMDATLSKLPELAPVRELMVGTGNSLWAQTEALTTNVKRQKYYTFAKELQKVIIAANAAFAKLGESDKPSKAATNECDKDDSPCMNKATDVADTRTAIINEAKAQAGEFAQLLNEMITVDRNYVLSPLMTKSAIAEVKGHENNIETLQKFVFQIEKLQ